MKRKIAAIMAADVVGYSRMMAEDEDFTLGRLLACREVFAEFVTRAHGRIFNTAGDAVLAEFPSAVEALRAAMEIQESIRSRNLAYPTSRQMRFRIGMTIGDVVEREGDLLGDGVNIAARLESLAEPGGICVSRNVHEQVAGKLSVAFRDIGPQMVKNLPVPVHAFTIPAVGALSAQRPAPVGPRRGGLATTLGLAGGIALLCVLGIVGVLMLDRPAALDTTHRVVPANRVAAKVPAPAASAPTSQQAATEPVAPAPPAPAASAPTSTAAIAPLAPPPPPAPAETESPTRTCDRLAAAPFDRENPDGVSGVGFVDIDAAEAVPACRAALAARPGNAHNEMELGRALEKLGRSGPEAFEHYRKAADGGDSTAMVLLGQGYETGAAGLPRDVDQAATLYRGATDAGNPDGMRHLGELYRAGLGVPQDAAQADALAERAAAIEAEAKAAKP